MLYFQRAPQGRGRARRIWEVSAMKRFFYYFTVAEWLLWTCSVALIVTSYCIFDDKDPLTLAASLVGVTSLISALIIELLNIAIFKGYRKDIACFVSGMLINPMTLPFYYLYCLAFDTNSIFFKAAGDSPWVAVGISAAVLAVCALGAGLGILISREIRKAKKLKASP